MVMKGRLGALNAFWERDGQSLGGVNARIPEWTGERYATLLQLAARSGQEEVTAWLLEDARADPTIEAPAATAAEQGQASESDADPTQDGTRRTAYDLARQRAIRDVFRRCAGAHPDWWDWLGAARVPSVLSKEMEEERDEKKKVRRKGLKDKIREREAKEKERERTVVEEAVEVKSRPKHEESATGPRRLGGSAGAAEGIAGLSPDMRAKVERERRARAAEARLKALSGRAS